MYRRSAQSARCPADQDVPVQRQPARSGEFDFYNLLNVGPVLVLNTAYGAAWQTPTAILPGRLFKLGVQLDF